MKKKIVLSLLMAALFAGGVFAQESFLSVGGGVTVSPSFTDAAAVVSGENKDPLSSLDFGVNAFIDVTYVELNVGLLFGNRKLNEIGTMVKDKDVTLTTLTFGLLGKFPLSIIKNRFVIFPFIGADYSMNLLAMQDGKKIDFKSEFSSDKTAADYFNNLSILVGVGVDLGLTDALYIRAEAGYGIVLNTKVQDEMLDVAKKQSGDDLKKTFISNGKIPIKLAVGFRF